MPFSKTAHPSLDRVTYRGLALLGTFLAAALLSVFAFAPHAQAATITAPLIFETSTSDCSGDGWSWEQSSCTLTLAGIDLDVSAAAPGGSALILPAGSRVEVSGENSIRTSVDSPDTSHTWCAIECNGDVIFNSASGASLTATGAGADNIALGVAGDLTISGDTYTFSAPRSVNNGSIGIYVDGGALVIDDAVVDASGYTMGIMVSNGNPSAISNSTITATADRTCTTSPLAISIGANLSLVNSSVTTTDCGISCGGALSLESASLIDSQIPDQVALHASQGISISDSQLLCSAANHGIDIGTGGLRAERSTIDSTSTAGYFASATRVGGDVELTESTLTSTGEGNSSYGMTLIPPFHSQYSGALVVNSGKILASGTRAAIHFPSNFTDPDTNHLILGNGLAVVEGGTLLYAENDSAPAASNWSFSTGSISYARSILEGASTRVVIDKPEAPVVPNTGDAALPLIGAAGAALALGGIAVSIAVLVRRRRSFQDTDLGNPGCP